ncbi:Bax inhibitor-1/YccA family protein [Bacteroidota bacterium]|jgi:FtsH-binding integral membrane protein|nr:Bax inhibitor-1/YccA family protein [Balneolaceae bacterium]MDC3136764.1 Bax inhibitor-1/YccA family protein [Bacteroidota bacterium]CAI8310701.1 MAG: Inner membrane protein YbhL [Rhodothermaeota bacterium MED-G12]|tara:strand:+ start:11486 stop:12184 length:699 start_codon:yes stop_codon:yes gene_type:complete
MDMQSRTYIESIPTVEADFMQKVYLWMTFALTLTGFVAYRTTQSEFLLELIFSSSFGFIGLILAELALVFWISSGIQRMSSNMAIGLFLLYSVLNGMTLSVLLIAYTGASVASTFFITAGMFGAMSVYGYTTKQDLSSWGNLLFMALIGLILASVVNIYLQSSGLYWLINYIGVLVFVGLTAYDTQKIKQIAAQVIVESEEGRKVAILGALTLYLDFINMFIFMLRILGNRR